MKKGSVWACSSCGQEQARWSGSCYSCGSWNALEEQQKSVDKKKFGSAAQKLAVPLQLSEIVHNQEQRYLVGLGEVDRLLGGGLVVGSLALLGGDPGVGKSTLLLQLAHALAEQGLRVLYVSGEESVGQVSLRAKRLSVNSSNLYLLGDTLFSNILAQIHELAPQVLIIDSIQILYKEDVPSGPGSVTQVRELATEFMLLSKGFNISTFMIGHVTKSGELAGPKVLEHLVDTVLEFEGDQQRGYRLLRVLKNRFGPTDEIAVFQMVEGGLYEVENPSAFFLKERAQCPGSSIVPTMEGSRALLVEVQALVTKTAYPSPARRCTGVDANRLALLLAVLEKRAGVLLQDRDVFVSVVGGMRVVEPALDLAVACAVVSSAKDATIDQHTVVAGEIGLGGEIRVIPSLEKRLREAIHMGFRTAVIPRQSLEKIHEDIQERIELVGVNFVDEALTAAMV